ncbi:MAG: triose-phosphate isomerase [Rhodothermales bacterium]
MFIAGNWKMNTDVSSAGALAASICDRVAAGTRTRVAVCPPYVSLESVGRTLDQKASPVKLGAQDMHFEDNGAFTGAISASMLASVGCTYVILGHSERRQFFGETDETVNRKVLKAMGAGLIPIVCIGETLEEREAGEVEEVVGRQVRAGLAGVSVDSADRLVLAYEPVWAIGTGRTASPEQAQDVHAFIRGLLINQFGEATGRAIHILYGGSMKPSNAEELLGQKDVDGGLIGGASLKADDFYGIIAAAEAVGRK